jgi:hypothetical protein
MSVHGLKKMIACFEIATALGILLFWILFFSVGLAPAHPPPGYFAFEHSFVLADSVLSVSLLVAGSLGLKGRPTGRVLSLMCAGSLIFLGLVDFSFNVRNGIYIGDFPDGVVAAAINFWCISFGIATGVTLGPILLRTPQALS